jgi:hypothetical protein
MQDTVSKIKRGLDLVILMAFSFTVLYPALFLLANYYKDVMEAVFENDPHHYLEDSLKHAAAETGFKVFKLFLFLVPLWIMSVWYDYFTAQKRRTTRFLIDGVSKILYRSIQNNLAFVNSLDRRWRVMLALMLAVFFIAECVLLASVPTSYDELFSYTLFSSKGAWTSLSYYPIPNNHMLYNLVTCLFVKLPIDPEIAIRLAALLASVVTVYYLFKLLSNEFGSTTALILVAFFLCLYPIQLFSFSARGYAFTNLCCVLLLYAIVQLAKAPASATYRWLFILSGAAGVAAVPSFLYAVLPIYLAYGLYLIIHKHIKSLAFWVRDCFVSGFLVFASYMLIYLLNRSENLTNPNGGATGFSLSDPDVFGIIIGHLKQVSDYLFLSPYSLFGVYVLMIIASGYSLVKTKKIPLLVAISFMVILSPLMILPLHRVLPFERNWLYLVFPFAVCTGFLLQNFLRFFKGIPVLIQNHDLKPKLACAVLALLLVSYTRFYHKHHFESKIDYEIASIRETYIDRELRSIRHIAFTNTGMEYYPAEFIRFLCFKQYPESQVVLTPLDSIGNQDVLVIGNSQQERFNKQLSNYLLLRHFDEHFSVYYKNPLK